MGEQQSDPCDESFADDALSDDDIDAFVLFADVAPDEVEQRKAEWQELFG